MRTGFRYGVNVIDLAMREVLPGQYDSSEARLAVLVIGIHETKFQTRQQYGDGPAHGLWQFEPIGVLGVLTHPATRLAAQAVCVLCDAPATVTGVYERLLTDDVLACAIARLYLWTDPKALPAIGDEAGMKDLYLRVWRPGKGREDDWPESYAAAMAAARG